MTPTVMALPKDGWRAVAPRMALAFQYEPMFVAGFPDSHRRLEKTEAFMRWLYRESLLGDTVVECTPSLSATAVWEPPGHKDSLLTHIRTARQAVDFMRLADRGDLGRFFGLVTRLQRRRRELVPEPHWYLGMLGVDPYRQRFGLGALLVRHGVARADAMGIPAYLDTDTPAKARFYEKLGFDVIEQTTDEKLHFPVWRMLRRPSPDQRTGDRQAQLSRGP
jgi:predicted N-acetyltransferase YhbS